MRKFTLALIAGGALFGSSCIALADSTPSTTAAPAIAAAPATTPAPVMAAAPTAPTTTAATTSDGSEIVCRSMGPPTGSRLGGHRECKSQHQWDLQRQLEEQDVSNHQHSYGTPAGN